MIRFIVPLCSAALLVGLVARASGCELLAVTEEAAPVAMPPRPLPASPEAPTLAADKEPPAPAAAQAEAEPPPQDDSLPDMRFDETTSLGGTKSGFGGLGLGLRERSDVKSPNVVTELPANPSAASPSAAPSAPGSR